MKNNLKIKKITSIILIVILLFSAKVYATNDRYETTISASNSTVKRDDNITITIGLADINIQSGEKGIGGYTASLKFESSVLEYVESNATDTWEAPFYQEGLITGNTKNGKVINTNQAIGTITFKVKDDAKLGETIVSLTNFSGTTAETDVTTSDKSVRIVIQDKENSNNNGNGSNNGENGGSNNNGSGSNNGGNSDNNNNGSGSNNGGNGDNNNNGSGSNNGGNGDNNNNGSGSNNGGNGGSNNNGSGSNNGGNGGSNNNGGNNQDGNNQNPSNENTNGQGEDINNNQNTNNNLDSNIIGNILGNITGEDFTDDENQVTNSIGSILDDRIELEANKENGKDNKWIFYVIGIVTAGAVVGLIFTAVKYFKMNKE